MKHLRCSCPYFLRSGITPLSFLDIEKAAVAGALGSLQPVSNDAGMASFDAADRTLHRAVARKILNMPRTKKRLRITKQRGKILMANDIYWVCVFKLEASKYADYKALVRPLIEETRKEPGNLAYEYCITSDRSLVHIIERYRDDDAVVWHVHNTFSKYVEEFVAMAELQSFTVYGDPGSARETLDSFNATYLERFDGYTK